MKNGDMTMMELHATLGNVIRGIVNSEVGEDREMAIESGRAITSVATQMINNGRFILDAEKLQASIGVLKHSKATDLIGD